MTTAVHQKPSPALQVPEQSKPAKILFQGLVALEKITVKEQVRKTFNENAHKELVESIRTKGLINPVTLRTSTKGYELVAGERRYRAAKAAGLKEIPAIVRELDDQAAALYQVEENIHRQNLTPIEQARGFQILTRGGKTGPAKYTVEQLARLVDKSVAFVYRSINLLELPAKVMELVETGTLTSEHGHQLLRVPAADREKVFKEWMSGWQYGEGKTTAKHLAEYIEENLGVQLSNAPFPKDKPYAGKSACSVCPHNSGNQGVLFDGAVKGNCTFKACFDEKTSAYGKEILEKTKAKYPKASEVKVHDGRTWIGAGSTAGGWVCKGAFDGKEPKGKYMIVIARDFTLSLWVPKPAEKRQATSSSSASKPKPADPREQYVEDQQEKAVILAALDAAPKNASGVLRILVADILNAFGHPSEYFERLKVKSGTELVKKVENKATKDSELALIGVAAALEELGTEDIAEKLVTYGKHGHLKKESCAAAERRPRASVEGLGVALGPPQLGHGRHVPQRDHQRDTALGADLLGEGRLPRGVESMSYMTDGLTFNTLRAANLQRLPQFKNKKGKPAHSKADGSDWKLSTWLNATSGEGGEMVEALLVFKALGRAANLAKKVERGDLSLAEAHGDLAKELADVAIYLDIVAYRANINLGYAVIEKFNEVSRRVRSTVRIREDGSDYELEPACRKCGCTEDNACAGGCAWAKPGLCTSCVGKKSRRAR